MEEDRSEPLSPEAKVIKIFKECDYEVHQAVGLEHGSTDLFATPRSGFIRPRTYFRVLPRAPEDMNHTLAELESDRVARKADRAIAIVMSGRLPDAYAPDLINRTSNVLTFRRWLLEVSGIADDARHLADRHEREREPMYLPRRGRLVDGAEVQLEPFIETWIDSQNRPMLVIEGPPGSGKHTLLKHAIDRAALRFLRDPEHATPLLDISYKSDGSIVRMALDAGAVVPVIAQPSRLRGESMQEQGWRCLLRVSEGDGFDLPPPGIGVVRVALIPPSSDEITSWFRERLSPPELASRLARARAEHDGFRSLSDALPYFGMCCPPSRVPLKWNRMRR
jgi:hypothetical protein